MSNSRTETFRISSFILALSLAAAACGSPVHPEKPTDSVPANSATENVGNPEFSAPAVDPWIGYDAGPNESANWMTEESRRALARLRDPEFYGALSIRAHRWLQAELNEQLQNESGSPSLGLQAALKSTRGDTRTDGDTNWIQDLTQLKSEFEARRNDYELGSAIVTGVRDLTTGALTLGSIASGASGAGIPVALAMTAVIDGNQRAFNKILKLYQEDAENSAKDFLSLKLRQLPEQAWNEWEEAAAQGPEAARKHASEQIDQWMNAAGGNRPGKNGELVQAAIQSTLLKAAIGEMAKEKSLNRLRERKTQDDLSSVENRLGSVSGALVAFGEENNRNFAKIVEGQQELAEGLITLQDGLGSVAETARATQGKVENITQDVVFMSNFMFSNMSVSEQKAALEAGFGPKLSAHETRKLQNKLDLVEKREKLERDVSSALDGASMLLSLGEQFGMNPKVIAEGRKITAQVETVTNLVGSVLSGNWMGALNGIGMLFGGGQGPSLADQRHQAVMQGLGAIQQSQADLLKGQELLYQGEQLLADYAKANLEISQTIFENQKHTFEALVQLSEQAQTYHQEVMTELDYLSRDVVINRELILAVGRENFAKCDSFFSTRPRFPSFNVTLDEFASPLERREHFSQFTPEFLSCVRGLDDLLKSGDNFKSLLASQSYSDSNRALLRLIDDVYAPTLKLGLGTPPTFRTAWFASLALPGTQIDFMDARQSALQEIPSKKLPFPQINEQSLQTLLAPEVLLSVAEQLLKVIPYLDLVDLRRPGELPSLSDILSGTGRRQASARAQDLLAAILEKVNLAIAQESVIAGQGILPDLYRVLMLRPVTDFAKRDATAESLAVSKNGLLAKNLLTYGISRALMTTGRSLYSYDAAKNFTLDARALREALGLNLNFQLQKGKWGVQFSGQWVALPSSAELAENRMEYRASMKPLIELRGQLASELAERELLRKDQSERRPRFEGLLLGIGQ